MIRSHAEYRKKLELYVKALHAWGFRGPHVVNISDYHGVMLELLARPYYIVNIYNELLDWSRPRSPWLVVDNPDVESTPPRGISAPVKPKDLIELEKDIERLFGLEFVEAASTAWHDPDLSAEEPDTRAWLEDARLRLASHIAAEAIKLTEQLGEKEVLVLPDKVDAYRDT